MNRQLIDPLLQQFQLKNLILRNRIVSTSHEPAYTEDGMPKARYRLYHGEKAKGGIGLTMMGGSAVVARTARRPSATSTSTRTRSCRGCGSSPTASTSTARR